MLNIKYAICKNRVSIPNIIRVICIALPRDVVHLPHRGLHVPLMRRKSVPQFVVPEELLSVSNLEISLAVYVCESRKIRFMNKIFSSRQQ